MFLTKKARIFKKRTKTVFATIIFEQGYIASLNIIYLQEESLTAFTKPEILDGNNKYKCENCNSLEDAEKGLGIKKLPSILAIQLKRYGFDYNTLHRIKLNDR